MKNTAAFETETHHKREKITSSFYTNINHELLMHYKQKKIERVEYASRFFRLKQFHRFESTTGHLNYSPLPGSKDISKQILM